MFYVLRFLVSLLLPPGLWVVCLFVLACLVYRFNRKLAIIIFCLFLIVYASSISLVSDALVRSLENRFMPPEVVQGDVIVVLMGGSTSDTPGIGGPGHPSGESASRLITAASLHRTLGLPIIISGGQVFEDSGLEGDIGQRSLVAMGVSAIMITVERESHDTAENASNVSMMLQQLGYRQPILVTSALHLPRSIQNFKKFGVTAIPYPTGYFVSRKFVLHSGLFTPSYDAVNKAGHAMKEYVGLLALQIL